MLHSRLYFLFLMMATMICSAIQAKEVVFEPSIPHGKASGKTVLLSILARNKAHTLPTYLQCLENLDYPKDLITIYINTNNNVDDTEIVLTDWIHAHKDQYQKIIYDSHEAKEHLSTDPHDWYKEKFKVLGQIRNKSMKKTLENNCDYYFVVDCDNFIASYTLGDLINKDKPIIAPMLRSVPEPGDAYSNFFTAISGNGYFAFNELYNEILLYSKIGTFQVPVVHCTYLIKSNFIKDLTYTDGTDDYEFVIFSRSARKKKIGQFITNEKDYGYLLHFYNSPTLEEETERFSEIWLNIN